MISLTTSSIFRHALTKIKTGSLRSYSKVVPFVRHAEFKDAKDILKLYKRVIAASPDSIFPIVQEITLPYVYYILQQAKLRGRAFVAYHDTNIIGFVKTYTSDLQRFAHIFTDITLMIEPSFQGQKFGKAFVEACLYEVENSCPHIRLAELYVHSRNIKAISLYEKLGFVQQCELPNRSRNADGTFSSLILMEWTNPRFCEKALQNYQQYLCDMSIKKGLFITELSNELDRTENGLDGFVFQ